MQEMADSTYNSTVSSELSEETLNQVTHGVGCGLSIVGAVHLLTHSGTDLYLWAGCCIYAISMVALYAASTLSHSFVSEPQRTRYRTLDQICIFGMMAATYTPVSLCACRDGWWNLPLVLMWLMAGLGTYLKLRITKNEMVPVWFYILLGAIPLLATPRLLQFAGPDGMFWILAAGCCYLLGIIFLTNDHRHRLFHPIWHVLVILGSGCHYILITQHVTVA